MDKKVKELSFEEFEEYVREGAARKLTDLFILSLKTKIPLFKKEVVGLMKMLALQEYSPPAKKLYDTFVARLQEEVGKAKEEDIEKMPPENLKRIMKTCLIQLEEWLLDKIREKRKRTEKEVYT